MQRLLLTATCLSALATGGALAADPLFLPDLRPSYPESWHAVDNDLRFEFGTRYWYSLGGLDTDISGFSINTEDTTHILEAHGRIDDLGTETYVKALGGFGMVNNGTYEINGTGEADMVGNTVAYAGGDFGWMPFGDMREGYALGALVGYQYWKDSPDTGRSSFTVAETPTDISWSEDTGAWTVGFDSEPNNLDIHALRLGASARFDLADSFDITAEAVAIPYAYFDGTLGAHQPPLPQNPGMTHLPGSATTIAGRAYGASGELMLGFHPTDNLTVRIGGRAWYLNGHYDAEWDVASVTPPQPNPPDADGNPADPAFSDPNITSQRYITTDNPLELFRYGALFELTGRF